MSWKVEDARIWGVDASVVSDLRSRFPSIAPDRWLELRRKVDSGVPFVSLFLIQTVVGAVKYDISLDPEVGAALVFICCRRLNGDGHVNGRSTFPMKRIRKLVDDELVDIVRRLEDVRGRSEGSEAFRERQLSQSVTARDIGGLVSRVCDAIRPSWP